MTVFYAEPVSQNGALKAFKLVDDNSKLDVKCPICVARAEYGLYNVQYEISKFSFCNFGYFCEKHRDLIFRFN